MENSIKANHIANLQLRRHLSRRDFFIYQYEGARGSLETMRKYTNIENKKMLDLGCGYGGASVCFAMNGLRVTAADNQLYEDDFLFDAIKFAKAKKAAVIFCIADAHILPFKAQSFDIIRLDSVLEHLQYPEVAMSECRRVLKPDGLLFVSFPLFYSPYGGHMIDYIKIPWFHTLPPRLVRWFLRHHKSKPGIITTDYVENLYLSLNKMTLKWYRKIHLDANLKEISFEETFYMPHDALLFINLLKKSIKSKSLAAVQNAFLQFNLSSVFIFIFLYLLYRLPINKYSIFNEMVVSGVRSVLSR